MRLSLLRSPLRPDPECDRGRQRFSFALLPHVGAYGESTVQEAAHAFNSPLRSESCVSAILTYMSQSKLSPECTNRIRTDHYLVRSIPATAEISPLVLRFPFVVEGARNVMLETIKRGEEDFPLSRPRSRSAPGTRNTSRSASAYDDGADDFADEELGAEGTDLSAQKTVVLRLFEHMGGAAVARLKM